MAEKVTRMKLKVDLQCPKCYKKVKKVLSRIPQIRSQEFDDKNNVVNITVVCCDPEKIRDKICCKGGSSIKSIEIVEPPKKPADDKKKDGADKPKAESDKKTEKPKSDNKGDAPKKDGGDKPKDKPADKGGDSKPKSDDKPNKPDPAPVPIVPPAPPPVALAAAMHVVPYYEGQPVGPYFHGYGQPTIIYDGYYGRPVYDSYGGGGRPYYVTRSDQYFNEENPNACSIM